MEAGDWGQGIQVQQHPAVEPREPLEKVCLSHPRSVCLIQGGFLIQGALSQLCRGTRCVAVGRGVPVP